jgi:hypothetical protein
MRMLGLQVRRRKTAIVDLIVNWQKGRQDWSLPSRIKAEIEKVTVDLIA